MLSICLPNNIILLDDINFANYIDNFHHRWNVTKKGLHGGKYVIKDNMEGSIFTVHAIIFY